MLEEMLTGVGSAGGDAYYSLEMLTAHWCGKLLEILTTHRSVQCWRICSLISGVVLEEMLTTHWSELCWKR